MCFSAQASFTASAGLFVIGAVAMGIAGTAPQRVLAATPLLFAAQQMSEGFLWISFMDPAHASWHYPAMYAFLLFAHVVWPVFVPLCILLPEKNSARRTILRFLTGLGCLTGSYFLYCLLLYPVSAVVESQHIRYDPEFPGQFRWISGLCYLLAAVLAPFLSGNRRLRLFGLILLVSYLATRIFFRIYLVSVWCYFAAVLSLVILYIVCKLRKEAHTPALHSGIMRS